MDLEARAKAIIRREASDKKVDRWEETKKKTNNNNKRLVAQAEKEQEKGEKETKTPLVEPITSTADMRDTSRATQHVRRCSVSSAQHNIAARNGPVNWPVCARASEYSDPRIPILEA